MKTPAFKFVSTPNPHGTGRVWMIRNAEGKTSITNLSASGRERYRLRQIQRLYLNFDFTQLGFL